MTSLVRGDSLPKTLELIQTLFKLPVKKVFLTVTLRGFFLEKAVFKSFKRRQTYRTPKEVMFKQRLHICACTPSVCQDSNRLIMKAEEHPVVVKEPGFHCLCTFEILGQSDKL